MTGNTPVFQHLCDRSTLSKDRTLEKRAPQRGSAGAGFQIVKDDRVSYLKNKFWVFIKLTTFQYPLGFFMWSCDRRDFRGSSPSLGVPYFRH